MRSLPFGRTIENRAHPRSPMHCVPGWDRADTVRAPQKLIPRSTWEYAEKHTEADSNEMIVCEYIVGRTDSYANKIYHRLFAQG